jgi:hypothetical protein
MLRSNAPATTGPKKQHAPPCPFCAEIHLVPPAPSGYKDLVGKFVGTGYGSVSAAAVNDYQLFAVRQIKGTKGPADGLFLI